MCGPLGCVSCKYPDAAIRRALTYAFRLPAGQSFLANIHTGPGVRGYLRMAATSGCDMGPGPPLGAEAAWWTSSPCPQPIDQDSDVDGDGTSNDSDASGSSTRLQQRSDSDGMDGAQRSAPGAEPNCPFPAGDGDPSLALAHEGSGSGSGSGGGGSAAAPGNKDAKRVSSAVQRVVSNRRSAARSRMRKLQHVHDLELKVEEMNNELQVCEGGVFPP